MKVLKAIAEKMQKAPSTKAYFAESSIKTV